VKFITAEGPAKLLQLLQWPSLHKPRHRQQHQQQQVSSSGANLVAVGTADALAVYDTMQVLTPLLQTAASLPGYICTIQPPSLTTPSLTNQGHQGGHQHHQNQPSQHSDILAEAAASWLHATYSPSGGHPSQDSPYSCCMLQLLHMLFKGPQLQLLPQDVEPPQDESLHIHSGLPQQEQQQQEHGGSEERSPTNTYKAAAEPLPDSQRAEWYESAGFRVLSLLLAGYPHAHLLVRGFLSLVRQKDTPRLGVGFGTVQDTPKGAGASKEAGKEGKALRNKVGRSLQRTRVRHSRGWQALQSATSHT
jgi:hypothetical protein